MAWQNKANSDPLHWNISVSQKHYIEHDTISFNTWHLIFCFPEFEYLPIFSFIHLKRANLCHFNFTKKNFEDKNKRRTTNLQTTQPPISISGALTTRVNLMTIGLDRLEGSPVAVFLPGSPLSLQFGQYQSGCWTHGESKQAAK